MGEVGGWEDQEERDGQADVTDFFLGRPGGQALALEARAAAVQEFLPPVLYVQLSPDFEMGQPQHSRSCPQYY